MLGIGSTAISLLVQSCSSLQYYATSSLQGNTISIRKSEFLFIKKDKQEQRPFILVKNEKLEYPICIYSNGNSDFTALYMRCTHRGCEIKPSKDILVCPCHGSEFSTNGIVQTPPAEKNLEQFKVTSDNENIYIHI